MSVAAVFLLIGVILMVVSAFVEPTFVSFYKLAWACFLFWLLLGAGHLVIG